MIKVGIIGAAGYTGGELIRLLINHPNVEISFLDSKSNDGNPVSIVHTDLLGETDMVFSQNNSKSLQDGEIDALFLCMGHTESYKFLTANPHIHTNIKIIDLSQDFRLQPNAHFHNRTFVYGLPEINKEAIQSAHNIANPGCFATAIQLGLLPLAKAGLLKDIYTTGITGSTGAGQGLSSTTHFSWRTNNISSYKTLEHQHCHEIQQSLHQLQDSFPAQPFGDNGLFFTPWRGDFARGIYTSSIVETELSLAEANNLYESFYTDSAFTFVSPNIIDLKQVVNTNKCLLHLEKKGNKLAIHTALDNLLKGASGQAVQNMNLMFSLPEQTGLRLKANAF